MDRNSFPNNSTDRHRDRIESAGKVKTIRCCVSPQEPGCETSPLCISGGMSPVREGGRGSGPPGRDPPAGKTPRQPGQCSGWQRRGRPPEQEQGRRHDEQGKRCPIGGLAVFEGSDRFHIGFIGPSAGKLLRFLRYSPGCGLIRQSMRD